MPKVPTKAITAAQRSAILKAIREKLSQPQNITGPGGKVMVYYKGDFHVKAGGYVKGKKQPITKTGKLSNPGR